MNPPRSQAASHGRRARQALSPDAGFRHPGTAAGRECNDLGTGTPMDPAVAGTIRLRSATAAAIADHELRELARAALAPPVRLAGLGRT